MLLWSEKYGNPLNPNGNYMSSYLNTFSTSSLGAFLRKCSAQGFYIPGQIKAPTGEQNSDIL
jgi:hypothetical protein